MARYPSGQPVTIPVTVKQRNTDGSYSLVDPTTLVLTVKRSSDGTTTTYPSLTHDGTGQFHQDVPAADTSQVDHYQWKAVSTGPGAGVAYGDFDVFDALDVSVLPLQDAKDMLNITATKTTYDAEIQTWIDTIEAGLEKLTGGPLVNRSVTEFCKVTRSYREIAVRQRPLVSVTSITDNATGTALSLTDLDPDYNAGIIRRKLQLPFWARGPYYTVVYTAGWGVPTPPAFNGAARIILAHLWDLQHGPSTRPTLGGDETTVDYGLGFAIPNRAAELLAPYALETALG